MGAGQIQSPKLQRYPKRDHLGFCTRLSSASHPTQVFGSHTHDEKTILAWRAHYTEKIAVAQFLLHGLRKAGLVGGRNAPGASLGVIRSMVWQSLDHGRATARSLDEGHSPIRKKLESFQNSVLREVLGLSKSAPKLALFGETGDLPDAWRERRKNMLIAAQMLTSDTSSIPYRVAMEANSASPKVGLFHYISTLLAEHGSQKRDTTEFKSKEEINDWIARRAAYEWRQGILGSTRLYNTYSQTKDLQLRGYLTTDFKGRQVLTKIRADDLELGASSYRGIGQSRTDACKTCKIPLLVETNEHFVLHCAALADARRRHPEVFSWIRERNPERSMAMIILAFPNNATEDIPRAKLVGEFLFDLWSTRATLLELRNTLR